MVEWLVLALVGLVAGLLSGMFGIGGGFLLVPMLVFIGWSLPQAIGTSLVYVAAMGAGGAWRHWRDANIDLKLVGICSIASVACAPLGAWLETLFPEWGLSFAFAVFLAATGISMGRGRHAVESAQAVRTPLAGMLGLGAVMGLFSGLFGVGGGVVFVPGQVRFFHIPMRRAVGNSLAAVLLTGIAGVVAHSFFGHVRWLEAAAMVAGGLVGLMGGTRLLHRLPVSRLRLALAIFLLLMAVYMALRGLEHFYPALQLELSCA